MSRVPHGLTRREMLALTGVALAGLPARASWSAPGARREELRIVFFTDVHTRVEWETPRALEMAATAINANRPELVVAGGDDKYHGRIEPDQLRWRGTTFITGGALCGKWWRGAWHGTGEGYGVLTLRPDRVDWEYHGYGWKALRP